MSPGTPTVGRLVRDARKQAGVTQQALADSIGCSKAHLSLMESGRRTISVDRAARMEQALGLADHQLVDAVQWGSVPAELRARMERSQDARQALVDRLKQALGEQDPAGALRNLVERTSSNVEEPLPLTGRIPVINSIAAGYPCEFTDLDYPVSIADEYIACPDVTDPNAFAARVVGDSMVPEYREGEIVVFSPALPTPSGSDCFVRLERDGETTFKRIFFEDDESTVRLQPLNNAYPPGIVNREDIGGIYAAAYVMRKVGM